MGIKEKVNYVLNHPKVVVDYFHLSRMLEENKRKGIFNFLFQCDAKGHFPYLKPYYDALKSHENVDIFITGANLDGGVRSLLLQNGIKPDHIIEHNDLVRLTEWNVYMSPTSWETYFQKITTVPAYKYFTQWRTRISSTVKIC